MDRLAVRMSTDLTDRLIDQRTQAIRYDWLRARAEGRDRDAQVAKFNAWLADVEARARRKLIDAVRALHTPVSIVFAWDKGLLEYPPCPTCYGKAGVHECGCWADEDLTYECRECTGREGKRRVVEYPCPTIRALENIDV